MSLPPDCSHLQHSNNTVLLAVRLACIFKHEARRKLDNAVDLNGAVHLRNPLLIPAVLQAAKNF